VAASILLGSASASAQAPPDAGRIQQEIERSRLPAPAPRPPAAPLIEEPLRPALAAPESARFFVKGFRITRASAFGERELLALLAGFTGKELSLADLQRAADVVTRHYRDRGYFVARAYVPAQEIRDGIVEITVLEGRIDRISVRPAGDTRLRESVIESVLRAPLGTDGLIREAELERGLLLLSDLPGMDAKATLAPGTSLGTSNVIVEVSEAPLVTGNADFDTYGNKFSGTYRLGATVNVNDPTGSGDRFGVRAVVAAGTAYARAGYQRPVGSSGWRAGAAYAQTRYELCCEFGPLDARGEAETATLHAAYPILRSRDASLYASGALDARRYFNSTIAGTTSDKKARVLTLGATGEGRDFAGGGGLTSFGIAVSFGRLDLDGHAADRALDDATARTHGSYAKTAYSLARLQRLDDTNSLYASLSGQFASKNLDSSEKLLLGGPFGVRGYPTGEAAGDEGVLFSVELRHDVRPGLQFAAFVDHGEIRLHRNEWPGWQGTNTRITNRYALSSYGVGLAWSEPGSFLLRASIARRMGDNPGRDANENDSDNTRNRMRVWMQAVKFF